jgi:hypothetical protein
MTPTSHRFSVAPMMDWTDRRCRSFHRVLTRRALFYSEMVTSAAVLHGDRERLLGFDPAEHPVALQLGGSDPAELAPHRISDFLQIRYGGTNDAKRVLGSIPEIRGAFIDTQKHLFR